MKLDYKKEVDYYKDIIINLRQHFLSFKKMHSLEGYMFPLDKNKPKEIPNTRSIEFDILFFNSKRIINFEVKVCRQGSEYLNLAHELDVRSLYCDKNYAIFVFDGTLPPLLFNIAQWNPYNCKSNYGCLVFNSESNFKLFSMKGAQKDVNKNCKKQLLKKLTPIIEQRKLKGDE